ncbi:MAG: cysteine--tRNA ligase [Candidatus Saccharibacteria bacterium]|nr:cysteine--tRNA ligase [Candidatus Saccharibacteria bacterium]
MQKDIKMRLYNQLTKTVEDFIPQDTNNVKLYTCGPTVYSFAHIGNLCSYIYWDLLVRTLEANNYKVNRVMNLTDVGHLTSDADDGEDKMEKGAKREHKTVWEIAEKYISAFLKDYKALNLKAPTKLARATDYIEQDKLLVDLLSEKGYTYETSDGIYFDTSKFPSYADFARLNLNQLKAGARVALSDEKRHISDFAVWKFIQPSEDHAMQWNYLGRPGYPGWHLECATIAREELGFPLDIHTGGIDHIPIHHTNEIAEAETAYGEKMSNFWTHCNFITIDGEKISKSLGNTYTLADLAKKGFSPMDYKLWVLQGHYQGTRNFSFTDLTAAKTRRLNWRNRIAKCYQQDAVPNKSNIKNSLLTFVSDNLNSPAAFAEIDNSELSLADWEFIDQLFGLNLLNDSPDFTAELSKKIQLREQARSEKDYVTADKIRSDLAEKNLTILDTPAGPLWQYSK